jgi:PAS domain S-box-containing protein
MPDDLNPTGRITTQSDTEAADLEQREPEGQRTQTAPENHTRVLREQVHLLDLAHDAIILRDPQNAILFWNHGAEELYGWTRDEALGKCSYVLLHTQFPQPLEAIEAEVLRTGYWEGELIQVRQDGAPLVVDSRWTMSQDEDTSPVAIMEINSDITIHKHVERSRRLLAEAGQSLAASLDPTTQLASIAQVVVPLLADWCVVYITQGQSIHPVAVAHADPQKKALADDLRRRHPPTPDAPRGVAKVLRTGQPEFYPETSDELLAAIAGDAKELELAQSLGLKSVMIVPLATRGHTLGALTLVVSGESGRQYTADDLVLAEELAQRAALAVENAQLYTQAKQLNAELEERVSQRTAELLEANAQLQASQAQLLRLAHHEQTAREEERSRLARELHDELGQNLTGLKMDLAWLQEHIDPTQEDLLQRFEAMFSLLDATIQNVRRIATELRPGILDDLGLLAAMEWLLQGFEKRTAIRCQFTSNVEKVALDADGTTVLFRILQEALTNVARHAGATQVEVSLDQGQDMISLRVQDNGRGILESEVDGSKSYGLLGMRERVQLRSGEFNIRGTPGQGTEVVIRLPLNHKDA